MKKRYFIRELALRDLEEIWLFTLSGWSLEQADAYPSSILARLNLLADNPSVGYYPLNNWFVATIVAI